MAYRSAEVQARFFLPCLRPGMSVLDCGCGQGGITIGLAAKSCPGETVGIDRNAADVVTAENLRDEKESSNLRFATADVYALPFPDASFDAVFSHALMEHLREPLAAVREMKRVLKPGGTLGVRAPQFDGNLTAPPAPFLERGEELYRKFSEYNGGNPTVGTDLPSLVRRAGFSGIVCTASYDCFSTRDAVEMWAGVMRTFFAESAAKLISLGWTDAVELGGLNEAYDRWARDPDAMSARAFVEVVARNP